MKRYILQIYLKDGNNYAINYTNKERAEDNFRILTGEIVGHTILINCEKNDVLNEDNSRIVIIRTEVNAIRLSEESYSISAYLAVVLMLGLMIVGFLCVLWKIYNYLFSYFLEL